MNRGQRPATGARRDDDVAFDDLDDPTQSSDITLDELVRQEEGDDGDDSHSDPLTGEGDDFSWPQTRANRHRSASAVTDDDAEEPALPPTDDDISRRVRRNLRIDPTTMTLRLHVETIDGVVYLRGTVETLDDGDLAAEVASRVVGVEDVVDETELIDR